MDTYSSSNLSSASHTVYEPISNTERISLFTAGDVDTQKLEVTGKSCPVEMKDQKKREFPSDFLPKVNHFIKFCVNNQVKFSCQLNASLHYQYLEFRSICSALWISGLIPPVENDLNKESALAFLEAVYISIFNSCINTTASMNLVRFIKYINMGVTIQGSNISVPGQQEQLQKKAGDDSDPDDPPVDDDPVDDYDDTAGSSNVHRVTGGAKRSKKHTKKPKGVPGPNYSQYLNDAGDKTKQHKKKPIAVPKMPTYEESFHAYYVHNLRNPHSKLIAGRGYYNNGVYRLSENPDSAMLHGIPTMDLDNPKHEQVEDFHTNYHNGLRSRHHMNNGNILGLGRTLHGYEHDGHEYTEHGTYGVDVSFVNHSNIKQGQSDIDTDSLYHAYPEFYRMQSQAGREIPTYTDEPIDPADDAEYVNREYAKYTEPLDLDDVSDSLIPQETYSANSGVITAGARNIRLDPIYLYKTYGTSSPSLLNCGYQLNRNTAGAPMKSKASKKDSDVEYSDTDTDKDTDKDSDSESVSDSESEHFIKGLGKAGDDNLKYKPIESAYVPHHIWELPGYLTSSDIWFARLGLDESDDKDLILNDKGYLCYVGPKNPVAFTYRGTPLEEYTHNEEHEKEAKLRDYKEREALRALDESRLRKPVNHNHHASENHKHRGPKPNHKLRRHHGNHTGVDNTCNLPIDASKVAGDLDLDCNCVLDSDSDDDYSSAYTLVKLNLHGEGDLVDHTVPVQLSADVMLGELEIHGGAKKKHSVSNHHVTSHSHHHVTTDDSSSDSETDYDSDTSNASKASISTIDSVTLTHVESNDPHHIEKDYEAKSHDYFMKEYGSKQPHVIPFVFKRLTDNTTSEDTIQRVNPLSINPMICISGGVNPATKLREPEFPQIMLDIDNTLSEMTTRVGVYNIAGGMTQPITQQREHTREFIYQVLADSVKSGCEYPDIPSEMITRLAYCCGYCPSKEQQEDLVHPMTCTPVENSLWKVLAGNKADGLMYMVTSPVNTDILGDSLMEAFRNILGGSGEEYFVGTELDSLHATVLDEPMQTIGGAMSTVTDIDETKMVENRHIYASMSLQLQALSSGTGIATLDATSGSSGSTESSGVTQSRSGLDEIKYHPEYIVTSNVTHTGTRSCSFKATSGASKYITSGDTDFRTLRAGNLATDDEMDISSVSFMNTSAGAPRKKTLKKTQKKTKRSSRSTRVSSRRSNVSRKKSHSRSNSYDSDITSWQYVDKNRYSYPYNQAYPLYNTFSMHYDNEPVRTETIYVTAKNPKRYFLNDVIVPHVGLFGEIDGYSIKTDKYFYNSSTGNVHVYVGRTEYIIPARMVLMDVPNQSDNSLNRVIDVQYQPATQRLYVPGVYSSGIKYPSRDAYYQPTTYSTMSTQTDSSAGSAGSAGYGSNDTLPVGYYENPTPDTYGYDGYGPGYNYPRGYTGVNLYRNNQAIYPSSTYNGYNGYNGYTGNNGYDDVRLTRAAMMVANSNLPASELNSILAQSDIMRSCGDEQKYIGVSIDNPSKLLATQQEILKHYGPPKHLTKIMIHPKTLDEAHQGIVYTGIDKTNKKQYVYGKDFVAQRKFNKRTTFLNMVKDIPRVESYINKYLTLDAKQIKNQLQWVVYACILKLSMSFYIRTGKNVYNKKHNTTGLTTLKKSSFDKDFKTVSFVGKKGVQHTFTILDPTFSRILKQVAKETPGEYLFSMTVDRPSEKQFYEFLRNDMKGLKIKDIRTYGCNITLIKRVYNTLPFDNTTDMVRKISACSIEVAEEIGHSKNISKSSYLIENFMQYFDVNDGSNNETLQEYINIIIDRIRKNAAVDVKK